MEIEKAKEYYAKNQLRFVRSGTVVGENKETRFEIDGKHLKVMFKNYNGRKFYFVEYYAI